MASFPLKNAHVSTPNQPQIIRARSFPLRPNAYPQYIRYGQTDRRKDKRQTTTVTSMPTA